MNKFGCFAEFDVSSIVFEDCVLDYGESDECVYASNTPGLMREKCPYWRRRVAAAPDRAEKHA